MNGYLLDTNVISELTKSPPDAGVLLFLSTSDDLWVPVIALHEVRYGLQLLPAGRRRDGLESTMTEFIAEYEERILPLDRDAGECAGVLRAQARRAGRDLTMGDALVAGTAQARDLAIATRNVADFDYLDVALANPCKPPDAHSTAPRRQHCARNPRLRGSRTRR